MRGKRDDKGMNKDLKAQMIESETETEDGDADENETSPKVP